MSDKRDHFDVIIVCALQSELVAARRVLEYGTENKFVNMYHYLPELNLTVCRGWSSDCSAPLSVAMTAQPYMGRDACQKHVQILSKHFDANVVVMTGICAGDESRYGNVEHGSVVIAKRTTIVEGGKVTATDYHPFVQYCEIDSKIVAPIGQVVEEEKSERKSAEWVEYIPDDAKRLSPRLVREHILNCLSTSVGGRLEKQSLVKKLDSKQLSGMTNVIYGQFLEVMQEKENPWICLEGQYHNEFLLAERGEEYVRNEVGFLRDDVITAIYDSMVTISDVTENLKAEMKKLKTRAGDRKIKAVDMESHHFMEKVKECKNLGIGVVIKGISDYGTSESKLDYYQVYAASTSAAFLRHLMTEKPLLFIRSQLASTSDAGKGSTQAVPSIQDVIKSSHPNCILWAVVETGAQLWLQIGRRMNIRDKQLFSLTENKNHNASKLREVIRNRQKKFGNRKTVELLLSACKHVNIYEDVIYDLQLLDKRYPPK